MSRQGIRVLSAISDTAVEKAASRNWEERIRFLDGNDAVDLQHKEMAGLLMKCSKDLPWQKEDE